MTDDAQHKPRSGITGKGFTKGDLRINRSGRPKSFDELRRAAQRIAGENVIDATGNSLTRIDSILRQWSRSKQPALQLAFVAYAYGKPPDKIETNALGPKTRLILRFAHEADRELSPFDCLPPNVPREMQRRLKGPEAPLDISENP